MYYFIGCFIRDYQPNLKKHYLVLWIVIIDIAQTLIRKYSVKVFVESYNNLGCVILSTLIFLIFYNLKAKRKNCFLKVFRKVTDTSLSFFLLSYIFDLIFDANIYGKRNLDTFMKSLPFLFITVHVNFLGSIIMGYFTHNITLLVVKSIHYMYEIFEKLYKIPENNNNKEVK